MPRYTIICHGRKRMARLECFGFNIKHGISWYNFAQIGVFRDDKNTVRMPRQYCCRGEKCLIPQAISVLGIAFYHCFTTSNHGADMTYHTRFMSILIRILGTCNQSDRWAVAIFQRGLVLPQDHRLYLRFPVTLLTAPAPSAQPRSDHTRYARRKQTTSGISPKWFSVPGYPRYCVEQPEHPRSAVSFRDGLRLPSAHSQTLSCRISGVLPEYRHDNFGVKTISC